MKSLILTFVASASLSVLGGATWAQEHDHAAANQGPTDSVPTMEDCRSMHHEMMQGRATADAAADAPAMAGMSDIPPAMRERMMQCRSMMQAAHGEDAGAMHHNGAEMMHQHEPATGTDDAAHDHSDSSDPH